VKPYLNLSTWIFFNWRSDGASFQQLVEKPELLRMRFQWFRSVAGETEQNFWRAFAISELHAVPMYGALGWLFEGLATGDEKLMAESLRTVGQVLENLTAVFKSNVKPELIDIDFFNQLQNTAHFGMASAGAGGFQLPFIMLLDALLGVWGAGNIPLKTEEVWEENGREIHQSLRSLIQLVEDKAPVLRAAVAASSDPALKESFDAVVRGFTKWRATHRARAARWLETSTVTTGRDNEDMEGNVRKTFQKEMDHIIAATRARAVCGGSAASTAQGSSESALSGASHENFQGPDVASAVCPFVGKVKAATCPFASPAETPCLPKARCSARKRTRSRSRLQA